MTRPLRIDRPGSWFHVVNRGIAKRTIFETRADARYFLSRVAKQVRLGRIEVHSFCLMDNHFHMLVMSPIGELSEAMRQIQNTYCRYFNRRHKRDGPLFRGRFHSRSVQSDSYKRAIIRYIDYNPVKAGKVRTAGEYEFGSASAYLAQSGSPWLERGWVEAEAFRKSGSAQFGPEAYLHVFDTGCSKGMARVAEFLAARARSTASEDYLESLVEKSETQVIRWMQYKAKVADGQKTGLPVCSQTALREALQAELSSNGPWTIQLKRGTLQGENIAWPGLLHSLCGLPWSHISKLVERTSSRTRRLAGAHAKALEVDARYTTRVGRVAQAAIRRTHE